MDFNTVELIPSTDRGSKTTLLSQLCVYCALGPLRPRTALLATRPDRPVNSGYLQRLLPTGMQHLLSLYSGPHVSDDVMRLLSAAVAWKELVSPSIGNSSVRAQKVLLRETYNSAMSDHHHSADPGMRLEQVDLPGKHQPRHYSVSINMRTCIS